MRIFKILVASMLLLCLVYSCSVSPEDLSPRDEYVKGDTPTVESVTEDVFDNILEGFNITEIINSGSSNTITSNYESRSSLNKSSSEDCNFEITNTLENINFNFDITRDYKVDPVTADEILSFLDAPVISTTESSIKYFLSDRSESTDCATEEIDAPVPNYNNRDELGRPTFFSYDDFEVLGEVISTSLTGEHHYSNQFYIERNETTTPTDSSEPSSVFNTEGTLEKRVDREHKILNFPELGTTKKTVSHIENSNLTGFFKPNQESRQYTFQFLNGSTKYFKYSYSIVNERDDPPTYGDTEIDIVNRYVVRFNIDFSRLSTEGTRHRFPFTFDITIDYKEIIKTLKENENSAPYTKTVPFYLDATDGRKIGTLTFILGPEEKWITNLTNSPTVFTSAEFEEFKVH